MPALAGPVAPPPLWLLTLVTFSGTFAMHVFVPALPQAAVDLRAGMAEMQLAMSVYILALAVGQLGYGPLSDRYGRRPVLIAGLALYAAASFAAALAPDAPSLIAVRLLQALGGCAGLVIGRATLRDTAGPQEAARRLALMNLMVVLGPGAAPLVGGALAVTLGWRSIFWALAGLGLLNLAFSLARLPETRPAAGADGRPGIAGLARRYGGLLTSRAFVGFAIGGGCATTSMYAFIGASPFIFGRQLQRPDWEIGLYPATVMVGLWLGSVAATRLIPRLPIGRLALWANLLSLLAALAMLAVVLAGALSVPAIIGPMVVFAMGAGIASPAALSQAMSVNPAAIGSASGLYGFAQMGIGAICAALAGLGDDPALTAAIILATAGGVGQIAFRIGLRAMRGA